MPLSSSNQSPSKKVEKNANLVQAVDGVRKQRIADLVPYLIIILDEDGMICHTNEAVREALGYEVNSLNGTSYLRLVAHHDKDHTATALVAIITGNSEAVLENSCHHIDGPLIQLKWRIRHDATENIRYLFGDDQTLAQEKNEVIAHMEKLAALEKNILHLNMKGETTINETADVLLAGIEKLYPGSACSILTVDKEQRLFHFSASASLPVSYINQINGALAGPGVGSCGTAIAEGRTVIVSNIDEDPLWTDYRTLASTFGLKACWSVPIFHSRGAILGSFAIYHYCYKVPTESMLLTIERLSNLIGLLMENSAILEDLRLSNERHRLVALATNDMLWDWDLQKDEIIRNEAGLRQVYGFEANDPILKIGDWLNRIHPDDRDHVKAAIAGINSGIGQTIFEAEYRFLRADDEYVHVYDRGHILRDLEGNPIRLIGAVRDMTERVKASQLIRESEKRYRHLFHENPMPMWIYDLKTLGFLEVNQMAIEHYGYSAEEFEKMSLYDIRSKNEKEQSRLRRQMEKNKKNAPPAFKGVWEHAKKNGQLMQMEIYGHNIEYKGREAALILAHDISQNILLQQLLMKEKIARQEEIIRVTIGVQEKERNEIGHELHDNVNQILTSAKLFLECVGEYDDKKEEYRLTSFNLINQSIEEIRKLSKSIVPPRLNDISLIQSIEDVLTNMKVVNHLKISFTHYMLNEKKIEKGLMLAIYRIVQEQSTNILKHSEATEVRVHLAHEKNGSLLLRIEDNGKGFNPDASRRGIGFANILNRAEVYHGQVRIDAAPKKGCVLSVLFEE